MKIIELTYFGNVSEEGVLTIRDRRNFDLYLKQFAGMPVTIDVKKRSAKRSNQQNAFFHSWVSLLAEYTGYSKDEMREIIKYKFLRVEQVSDQTGEVFTFTKSTTKLNKSEFSDFCTEVQEWSKNVFGVILPLPSEQWTLKLV